MVKNLIRENSVLILKLNVMKELSFEKMENLNGGSEYCDLLYNWLFGGVGGFQGDTTYLFYTFIANCGVMYHP